MRRGLTLAALAAVAAACASMQRPPGGPPRHEPPEVIAISPDSNETAVRRRNVQITFDEVVRDQSIGKDNNFSTLVQISPKVGNLSVSWHRYYIVVKGHDPFRPNTTYRITLLPGVTDLHNNQMKIPVTSLFSTGTSFDTLGIVGTVWDWESQKPAGKVTVFATSHLSPKDSVTYVATTDSVGHFELGPMPAGRYSVLAFIDQNNKGVLERTDKYQRMDTAVVGSRPALKMMVIERDSAAPIIATLTALDSLSLRVDFNEFLDPLIPLQPALVRVQSADSTELLVDSVHTIEQDNASRPTAIRTPARRDTVGGAAAPAVPAPAVPIPAAPVPVAAANAPRPLPKPPQPPPTKSIVVYLSRRNPLQPATTYRVTAMGFRNLLGASKTTTHNINIPRPAPAKPPPPPQQ